MRRSTIAVVGGLALVGGIAMAMTNAPVDGHEGARNSKYSWTNNNCHFLWFAAKVKIDR